MAVGLLEVHRVKEVDAMPAALLHRAVVAFRICSTGA
jgi:hypothetical protein